MPASAEVKEDIKSFFINPQHWAYRYGSPTPKCTPDSPYHRIQIETIFEDKYFHWVTHRAIDELVSESFLRLERTSIAHFVYRSDIRYTKRDIKKRCKIIKIL